MKLKLSAALLRVGCVVLVACASTVARGSTLAGDSVTFSITGSAGGSCVQTVTVVAGPDGTCFGGGLTFDFNAGSGGDLFTLTSAGNFGGVFSINSSDTVTITLSGLDFPGASLTSFPFIQPISNVSLQSLTATSVSFKWNEGFVVQGVFFEGQFVTSAAAVPGPIAGAGLPGLTLAFGGFVAWRRRRQKAA